MAVSGAAGARAAMLHVPRSRRRSSTASYVDSSGHGSSRTPSIALSESLEYNNRNGRPPDLEGDDSERISDIYMDRRYGAEVNAKDTLIAVEQWKRNQTEGEKLTKAQKRRREYEMAALSSAPTSPFSDALDIPGFGGDGTSPAHAGGGKGGGSKKLKGPVGFFLSVLRSNRSLFIFSEQNFIRRCAKWLTEWPYPFYCNVEPS